MNNRPILLTDVAELSNALRAMDDWEATGEDLDSAHDRRRFVDSLDDDAADELAGLALTNLARMVLAAKVAVDESRKLGEDTYPRQRDAASRRRYGYQPAAA